MNEQKALQIANEYAKQHNWNCDIVWFAGVVDEHYFVWLKNTSLPRYTGFGYAVRISPTDEIVDIESNIELHEISKAAMKLNNGNEFF
jgi:hypothetical protein